MKIALLSLFNSIKEHQCIPQALQFANISTIFKNKGSKQDLDNDRGIFLVSVLRMILDSLIYRDKYPIIDFNMTCSNIGARKNRNIRDHLFIVYSVVNSVIYGHEDNIDIQIYDVKQCFDALWLDDVMLDLIDTLPEHER